jgi:hypothetical protein
MDVDRDEMNTTEVLDLETMEFTGYGPAMLTGHLGCAAVADDAVGDRVFVHGGNGSREIEVLEEAATAQEESRATRRRR